MALTMLTVHRRPLLVCEKGQARQRTRGVLEAKTLPAELLPRRRVQVRFTLGDWLQFRDNGEACLATMSDYVLAPESVAVIRAERAREKAARRKAALGK